MHPLSIVLADAASSSSDLKTVLITAGSVVLAASIPAILSRRERTPREVQQLRRDAREERARLTQAEADAEHRCQLAEARAEACEQKLHVLERFVWRLGYDPETQLPAGGGPSGT